MALFLAFSKRSNVKICFVVVSQLTIVFFSHCSSWKITRDCLDVHHEPVLEDGGLVRGVDVVLWLGAGPEQVSLAILAVGARHGPAPTRPHLLLALPPLHKVVTAGVVLVVLVGGVVGDQDALGARTFTTYTLG